MPTPLYPCAAIEQRLREAETDLLLAQADADVYATLDPAVQRVVQALLAYDQRGDLGALRAAKQGIAALVAVASAR